MAKTDFPIVSEVVEPTMAYIMGKLFKQVEEYKDDLDYVIDGCFNLWIAANSIDRLSTCCTMKDSGATHFSIAAGNNLGRVADYIKEKCGFNPLLDKEHPVVKRWNSVRNF